MNAAGSRPYCQRPAVCPAGSRGRCRVCHGRMTDQAKEMIAYHNNGEQSFLQVARKFKVSAQHVSNVLKRAGVTARKVRHRSIKELTPDQYRYFRTLCGKGIPAAFAHEEVRRFVAPAVQVSVPVRWQGEELARLREAYENGPQKLKDLVVEFKTSLGSLSRLVCRHGWKRRGPDPLPDAARQHRKLYKRVMAASGREAALRAVAAQ